MYAQTLFFNKKKNFIFWLIIAAVILIILAWALIINEIEEAKDFCDSVEGNYSLKFPKHFCNGKELFKYPSSFDFERNFTLKIP